ncbi:hypothetical protein [Streptomyces sp. NPDC088183]|uniref:hypothetical protein n=1 Tax=Streptomyces sp. NPDC088183 TaxID=3160992 RepID=UPI003431CE26
MTTRIEFKGFVDVYDGEPLTAEDARGWVETALLRGDKHGGEYDTTLDEVTFFSTIGDND